MENEIKLKMETLQKMLKLEFSEVKPGRKAGTPRWLRYWLEDKVRPALPGTSGMAHLIPMSEGAKRAFENSQLQMPAKHNQAYFACRKLKLVWEHCVPLKSIYAMLLESRHDADSMWKVLTDNYRMAWLTEEENRSLGKVGLQSKMPDNWDGSDPYARYNFAGVHLTHVSL